MHSVELDVSETGGAERGDGLFRSVVSTLQAKSLAIVGASERARWPSEIYKNLREFSYPGRIALVNPRQAQVFGERCFASLRSLPEPVDHALVIVPAAFTLIDDIERWLAPRVGRVLVPQPQPPQPTEAAVRPRPVT